MVLRRTRYGSFPDALLSLPSPRKRQQEVLFFMSFFTLKNGEKLYYEDRGEGPDTVIMMHGWTSTHELYVKPAEMLQKHARCIIYDHRGHGGSKDAKGENPTMETLAEDLNELIQGLVHGRRCCIQLHPTLWLQRPEADHPMRYDTKAAQ